MSKGRRSSRTQPPPQPRRRSLDLNADLGTSTTLRSDEGVASEETQSSDGTASARVPGGLTYSYEAPPATAHQPKSEPAWKNTAELIAIIGALLVVVGTSAYLLAGLSGVESKVDDAIQRVDSVATTTTRIDAQVVNVQTGVNELQREVQELRRDSARAGNGQQEEPPAKRRSGSTPTQR